MLYPPIDPATERRARLMLRILAVWGVLIFGRMVYLQVIQHKHYATLADSQQIKMVEIPAHRGAIYDRTGHALALTIPTEKVVVNPSKIKDFGVAAGILSSVLGLEEKKLYEELRRRAGWKKEVQNGKEVEVFYPQQPGRSYFVVARHVHPELAHRMHDMRLSWLFFESNSKRVYPNEGLAAHVLGRVDATGAGSAGIEQGLEAELGGHSGYANMAMDVAKRGFASDTEVEPIPGNDVQLTIDHRIQFELERQLKDAVEKSKCQTGRGLVMDPNTGEILALASYPTFNPNEKIREESGVKEQQFDAHRNNAVQSAIEPGSVFKVITVASAIEDKVVTPEKTYFCHNGRMNLFGRMIRDAHPYGWLSVQDIVAKSSNLGTIQVAMEMGVRRFYDWIRKFGFGDKTGIPLPGESSGRVIRPENWTKSSIGSVAMGHEVMVTTVQLGQALSVIANGGYKVRPQLVKSVGPNRLSPHKVRRIFYEMPAGERERVLSPETVVTMRNMLDRVVQVGTGKGAKISGYSSGGKTGSAQMFDPKTHRYLHKYHASFMGFAPVNNPRIVVVITLDGSSLFGGVVAAPVFSAVASAALRTLNVPPDLPVVEKPEVSAPEVMSDLAFAELVEEKPEESLENPAAFVDREALETRATLLTPNLVGKSLREAAVEGARQGFRIAPKGSGLVRQQNPEPGSPIAFGQKIEIKLAR